MTYFCNECKQAFDEFSIRREWVGDKEHGGYVEYSECPNCGSSDFEAALICPECGEFCGELFGDGKKKIMCDECIKKLATEENLIAYGYEDKQSVELNSYYVAMIPEDEIERILEKEFKARKEYVLEIDKQRREEYIEDCKDNLAMYFTEMQEAEGNK